ncbi:MAG: hypothetical protein MUO21_07515, partial [Nitrososphaeraceae archaeon]|nr:hypothetical protein [Nitrososphaeraceae archaeon]
MFYSLYSANNFNPLLEDFVDKKQFLKQLIYFDRLGDDSKEEEKAYIQPLEPKIKATFKNIWEKADFLRAHNRDPIL